MPHSLPFTAVCYITSSLFCIFYLGSLVAGAFARNFLHKPSKRDPSVSLAPSEKKLVFELGYYVRLAGFDLEHHTIETSDGFLLEGARIIDIPDPNLPQKRTKPKYPVLLIPGLMQGYGAYCTSGPDAIALVLHRAGYDVWLCNNRGGFTPKHKTHSHHSHMMWDWSMVDLALLDVPAMVHHVLARTGASHLAIGGHSQGTAQTFLALSTHSGVKGLGPLVSSFCALAPAVYAGPLVDRWFLKMLRCRKAPYCLMIGRHTFLGSMCKMSRIIPQRVASYMSYVLFNYMLGWTDVLWDRHYRDRNFIFAPTYVSSKHMFWWLGRGGFADTKCLFDEAVTPWFDETFPKLGLFVCGRDDLCDGLQLINHLRTHEHHVDATVFDLPAYSHLDALWAQNASTEVAQPMVKYIWDNISDKENYQPIRL